MPTTSVLLAALVLTAAVAAALPLARSAAFRWSTERAGRAYELPADYRPAALRAGACALLLTAGASLAVTLPAPATRPTATAAVRPFGAPAPPPPPHTVPRLPAARRALPGRGDPSGPATPPRTVAEPAGGVLQEFADGTRVWLPPQYAYRGAVRRTFPLAVACLPDAAPRDEPLFAGFDRAVRAGLSDPFVVVLPADCGADPLTAVAEAARYYRVVPGVRGRGLLGVGPRAPIAVRAALTRPGLFGAFAGVAGRYDGGAVPLPAATVTPAPDLLLAAGSLEGAERDSAVRLSAALRPRGVRVRLADGLTGRRRLGGERGRELALTAQYLTEQLAAPGLLPGTTRPYGGVPDAHLPD